jgi:hypothetical protein
MKDVEKLSGLDVEAFDVATFFSTPQRLNSSTRKKPGGK